MAKKGKNVRVYLLFMIFGGIAVGLMTAVIDTMINSTDVKAESGDLYGLTADDVWQRIYPIGSIYVSTNSESPETLFGGTWEAFGQGRTLVGVGSNGTTIYAADSTGGSETKTIAEANLPAHSHSISLNTGSAGSHAHSVSTTQKTGVATSSVGNHQHSYIKGTGVGNTTLTASQIPSHNHPFRTNLFIWKNSGNTWNSGWESCIQTPTATSADACFTWADRVTNGKITNNTGGGGAHNHGLNTAGDNVVGNGGHAHTLTVPALSGTAASNGSHAHSVSGNTGNTGSGTALNTQDPYITVYMWKRTA